MPTNKQKIAVIGSTGSVGVESLNIVFKFKDSFKVDLLVFDKNYRLALKQIKKFQPRYVYVENFKAFNFIKKKTTNNTLVFNDLLILQKNIKSKFDKTILAVPGTDGLKYAFLFLKKSKKLLIANKESIICGGKFLLSKANAYKCKIVSIDSEHYCIGQSLLNKEMNNIDTVYLTASGGPFLGKNNFFFRKSSVDLVTNHPNWKMGKKISTDSATMVNKIFELIEAHILYKIPHGKLKIIIHKESLAHCAIVLKNGLVRIIMHDTSMAIPIRNSLFDNKYFSHKVNIFKQKKNFQLNFSESLLNKFEIVKLGYNILKNGHCSWILFNVFNDFFVEKFLKKEIFFYQITKNLIKIFNDKLIIKYCKTNIKSVKNILFTIDYAKNYVKNYKIK
jgi:1-deoxy-D-xylulose-5-phosphate reductoisomerase